MSNLTEDVIDQITEMCRDASTQIVSTTLVQDDVGITSVSGNNSNVPKQINSPVEVPA